MLQHVYKLSKSIQKIVDRFLFPLRSDVSVQNTFGKLSLGIESSSRSSSLNAYFERNKEISNRNERCKLNT